MANSYNGTPIVLDTFTGAIDVASSKGFPTGAQLYVKSIEWQTPTNANHTCTITKTAGGTDYVFAETCTVANQSVIKYFNDWIPNLCIAISGVESGKVIIHLG
jgi:hypothetical protein